MHYRALGRTGLNVSVLSFGASSLGGVFRATDDTEVPAQTTFKKAKARKPAWPSTLPERMKAVAGLLSTNAEPMDSEAVARAFAGKSEAKKQIPEILETLVALGRAQAVNKTEFAAA